MLGLFIVFSHSHGLPSATRADAGPAPSQRGMLGINTALMLVSLDGTSVLLFFRFFAEDRWLRRRCDRPGRTPRLLHRVMNFDSATPVLCPLSSESSDKGHAGPSGQRQASTLFYIDH